MVKASSLEKFEDIKREVEEVEQLISGRMPTRQTGPIKEILIVAAKNLDNISIEINTTLLGPDIAKGVFEISGDIKERFEKSNHRAAIEWSIGKINLKIARIEKSKVNIKPEMIQQDNSDIMLTNSQALYLLEKKHSLIEERTRARAHRLEDRVELLGVSAEIIALITDKKDIVDQVRVLRQDMIDKPKRVEDISDEAYRVLIEALSV